MAIWSISASPLIMGNDMRKVAPASLEVLLNEYAIAVSQDILGQMGTRLTGNVASQIWAREMANGDVAVALYNHGGEACGFANITLRFDAMGIDLYGEVEVFDIWAKRQVGIFSLEYTAKDIPCHGTAFLRLTGKSVGKSRLVNSGSNKCLDIYSGPNHTPYPANEAHAQILGCDVSAVNQIWLLHGNTVLNPGSGKCLDIYDHWHTGPEGLEDGTKVELYSCNNGKWNQQFEIRNGKLVNPPSGKCVAIREDTYPADGSLVEMSTCGDVESSAQVWNLMPISTKWLV